MCNVMSVVSLVYTLSVPSLHLRTPMYRLVWWQILFRGKDAAAKAFVAGVRTVCLNLLTALECQE